MAGLVARKRMKGMRKKLAEHDRLADNIVLRYELCREGRAEGGGNRSNFLPPM